MSGSGTWSTGFWGQNQWNDLADPTFSVTGIALTASLGDETTVGEINFGWGRLGWNEQAWGIASGPASAVPKDEVIAIPIGNTFPTISIITELREVVIS